MNRTSIVFPPLYCIADRDAAAAAGWTLTDLARAFLDGGARLLQVRAKSAASGPLLALCEEVAEEARAAGSTFIVNDRLDVALLAGADGVHLGQDDLPVSAARSIPGRRLLIGFSTHNRQQVDAALDQPVDYLAVGPVFGTRSKAGADPAVGLDLVRYAASLTAPRGIPLVAIGGITLETAPSVIGAGATGVAVISDLLGGDDPSGRVRDFISRLA